jgi:hypothetical protein
MITDVAIVFGLVINFGSDEESADAARRLAEKAEPLAAGPHRVRVHSSRHRGGPAVELGVVPVGVSWGSALDRDHPRVLLTAAELTELGFGLFEMLKGFTGYRAAAVGWDCEPYVDLDDLETDLADGMTEAELQGRVIAADVLPEARGPLFVPFAPGYVWVPYAGERPSTLTAD